MHLPSVYSLTDSLTHSSVRIMLLKTNKGGKIKLWPNSYKVSGSKSLRQRSLEATTWIMSGSCQGDLSFDSSTSLNYIEQFCHGFICHPQVKFVLFNKTIFPYLQLAPSGYICKKELSIFIRSFFFPNSKLVLDRWYMYKLSFHLKIKKIMY